MCSPVVHWSKYNGESLGRSWLNYMYDVSRVSLGLNLNLS